MKDDGIPEFAVVGHPNEGKSSVVSTLTEDDSVRVSPTPGETTHCRVFPVSIDGEEIIRFIDTPGFQNPEQTLLWMKHYDGPDEHIVRDFRREHCEKNNFRGDCELFDPIERGAGIIYVVDGSRPLRKMDKAEMEALRLTGRPRMALINCKDEEERYLDQWKNEFRKHFNSIRVFNSNRATYAERIDLLESLKGIDQDWQPAISKVVSAFKRDWKSRNAFTVDAIILMLEDCLSFYVTENFSDKLKETSIKEKLKKEYMGSIEKIERKFHEKIRKAYKHNIFNYSLPEESILGENLFSKTTWQFLGLTSKQLITASALAGLTAGAFIDIAAAGLTFGIFSSIGGALGAAYAALGGGERLSKAKVRGIPLGGQQIKIGPNESLQFMYILLDRSLIFYSHIINWAHGRRDYTSSKDADVASKEKRGYTATWNNSEKIPFNLFFKALRSGNDAKKESGKERMRQVLTAKLQEISRSESVYTNPS
jgi:predicted GTPase